MPGPKAPSAGTAPATDDSAIRPTWATIARAATATPAANAFNLLWNSTNVGKSFGKQDIKEAYGEIAVPVLRDVFLATKLDLNAAARYVDYSVTGSLWACIAVHFLFNGATVAMQLLARYGALELPATP